MEVIQDHKPGYLHPLGEQDDGCGTEAVFPGSP